MGRVRQWQFLMRLVCVGLLTNAFMPSSGLAEEIPLIKAGGVYELPLEINGVMTLRFILDTGAAEVNIPADVVLALLRTGTLNVTDFLPGATYTLADGSRVNSRFPVVIAKLWALRNYALLYNEL
jgi:hypothetical protein